MGLHRLDEAGVETFEVEAGAVVFFDDGKVTTICAQARAFLNELCFIHAHMRGDGGHFLRCDDHVPGPTTAIAAALAEIRGLRSVKRHEGGRVF